MDNNIQSVRFFTGSNSGKGFYSLFDKIYNAADGWNAFLIKGGPGTGKSSLMKRAGKILSEKCDVEYIHCSSDPDSLDGVVLPHHKICILDATSPHALEPKYPGVCENIVPLGECWNKEAMRKVKTEVIALSNQCSILHARARKYISAAANMQEDTYRYALECVDVGKLARFASRLCKRELGDVTGKPGSESMRMLSALTPRGPMFFADTIEELCPRIYSIEDEYGAVSDLLMQAIRKYAIASGNDIITCICPLIPENIEHILIPEKGIGFITTNRWHFPVSIPDRRIHIQRFTDMDRLKLHKQRISFNRRVIREMLAEAANMMTQAKQTHDLLERYYINAMDFDMIDEIGNDLIAEILLMIE